MERHADGESMGRRRLFLLNGGGARVGIGWLAGLLLLLGASGCIPPLKHRSGPDAVGGMPSVYEGQSLRSIGEHALVAGEDALAAGHLSEARALFGRALWAFEYHLLLTGEEPPLLDAARDGWDSTGGDEGGEGGAP